jgi:hypothetical protein
MGLGGKIPWAKRSFNLVARDHDGDEQEANGDGQGREERWA